MPNSDHGNGNGDGNGGGDDPKRVDLAQEMVILDAMVETYERLLESYPGIFARPFPPRLYVVREAGLERALGSALAYMRPRAYYTLYDRRDQAGTPRAVALPERDLREFLALTDYRPEIPHEQQRAASVSDPYPGVYLRPDRLAPAPGSTVVH